MLLVYPGVAVYRSPGFPVVTYTDFPFGSVAGLLQIDPPRVPALIV